MTNISSNLSDQADQAADEVTAELAVEAVVDSDDGAEVEAPVDAQAATAEPVERTLPAELLQRIVEGALLAAGKPLAVDDLAALFEDDERPPASDIRAALAAIAEQSTGRGFELREVASGYRFQVVQEVAPWIARLWEEKPQKYSRALLETLALIAYRQPITRGDIEDIRGVAVATNIIKTLLERDWVRVVGHKDVPGRPAMYATTRRFLDYFNLKNLDELPPLADLRDLDALSAQLSIEGADTLLPELQEGAGGDVPVEASIEVDSDTIAGGDHESGSDADTTDVDAQALAEEVTSTEVSVDTEPLEPEADLNRSED